MEGVLRRLVGAVTRRPLLVLASHRRAGAGRRRRSRCGWSRALPPRTLVDQGSSTFRDTERFKHDFGDDGDPRAGPGRPLADGAHLGPRPADPARGLPLSGNVPTQGGARRDCRPSAARSPSSAGQGRLRARHVRQHGGGPDPRQFAQQQQAKARQAQQAAEAARRLSKRRGDSPAEQERLAGAAAEAVQREVHQRDAAARAPIRDQRRAARRRPELRVGARVRPDGRRAGHPKARFAYLFPSKNAALIQMRLRPDLTDAERDARDRPDRDGHAARRPFRPQGGRESTS